MCVKYIIKCITVRKRVKYEIIKKFTKKIEYNYSLKLRKMYRHRSFVCLFLNVKDLKRTLAQSELLSHLLWIFSPLSQSSLIKFVLPVNTVLSWSWPPYHIVSSSHYCCHLENKTKNSLQFFPRFSIFVMIGDTLFD